MQREEESKENGSVPDDCLMRIVSNEYVCFRAAWMWECGGLAVLQK